MKEADQAAVARQRLQQQRKVELAWRQQAAEEQLQRAKMLRNMVLPLPLLASHRLSYVQGDAASQVHTLPAADVVIVDPPRKGLEDVVLNALVKSKKRPQRLIYVSCGFPAFRQNAARLLDAAWKVTHAEGFVLFPGAGTSSEQLAERLSTGAVVEELQLAGERLQYKLVTGTGPSTGWVSISLKDKALLIRQDAAKEKPSSKVEELKDGDYFVTLGPIFKKAGSDPSSAKIMQLNRKIGMVIHTTSKIWKGPTGGFWVELDTSSGDSGAGEKMGYVLIDGSGFGTPGPCLQKASKEDGFPMVLKAIRPEGLKAWDGSTGDKAFLLPWFRVPRGLPEVNIPYVDAMGKGKEFLAFPKTTGAEMKIVLAMLYGVKAEEVKLSGKISEANATVEGNFQHGDSVQFEVTCAKTMKLIVMNPLELGDKLTELEIKEDWTIGQVRKLLCSITGLKEGSTLMAKGKMGERVSEDAQLKLTDLVVDCGYKDGDEIGFIYLGDPAAELSTFLAKR
eukprot:symbB.v1.2.010016.t1/scaffold648.1/size176576/1